MTFCFAALALLIRSTIVRSPNPNLAERGLIGEVSESENMHPMRNERLRPVSVKQL